MIAIDFDGSDEWQRMTPEERTRWGRSAVAARIMDASKAQGLTGKARDNFAMREWMSAYCFADERSRENADLQVLARSLWVNSIAVATRGFSVVEEFAREG
ncbi:MAG TPA: hypothetical protein VIL69_00340 [Roseomonas sp.]